jgi:putative two-component system response regulator
MSRDAVTPARPRVLIVDDCETSLMFEELALTPNYEVLKARDGDEALRIVEHQAVDLVLLDLMLPSLDGFGVLRRLRSGPAAHVPVLVLTVRGDAEEVARAHECGCNGYMTKPVSALQLLRAVSANLGA